MPLQRYGSVNGLNVLVLGAGTIGNLVAQVASAMGAKKVLITDISEYKLQKARECGIEHVINPQQEDLSQAILNTFGPDKADLILECVGVQDTISQAVANARKGSTIIVVGVFGKTTGGRSGSVARSRIKSGRDVDVSKGRLRACDRTCVAGPALPGCLDSHTDLHLRIIWRPMK